MKKNCCNCFYFKDNICGNHGFYFKDHVAKKTKCDNHKEIEHKSDICCDALEKWGVCQCESFRDIEVREQ